MRFPTPARRFLILMPFCALLLAPAWSERAQAQPSDVAMFVRDQRVSLAEFDAAERRLEARLARASTSVEAYMELGRLKAYRRDHAGAILCFRNVLALDPRAIEAEILLSHALLNSGDYNQALSMAERLIKDGGYKTLAPALQAELHTTLGLSLGLKATKEGMIAMMRHGLAMRSHLERALEIDASYPLANLSLGRFLLEAPAFAGRDEQRGLRLVEKAVQLAPMDYLLRSEHIDSLISMGRKAEAKAQIDRYLIVFGDFPPALETLKPVRARL